MEAISSPLDDFNLVIDSLKLPGINRIIAVIQDSIAVLGDLAGIVDKRMVCPRQASSKCALSSEPPPIWMPRMGKGNLRSAYS